MVAPKEPDGVELVLHLADEPARAFQPRGSRARGGVRQGTLKDGYGGMDAVFADSCGNLLDRHQD
jgi:hypothetical protein